MAALTALVLAVVATSGFFAERGLRARVLDQIEDALGPRARLVADRIEGIPFTATESERLQPLAQRASQAAGARVTLIAPDGTVVADSDVPIASLPELSNHSDRPEVRSALRGEKGVSTRLSDSVMRRLLYLALPAENGAGVVRLAVDLDEIDAAARELRRELVAAGALGVGAALILSFVLSWLTLRPVREMREVVSDIADGKLERRLRWPGRDELGEIANSINRVAEQLRQRLDDATAEKEQLEAVLSGMVEGVLVLDLDGRVILANPRLRELLSAWGPLEGRRPLEVLRNSQLDSALREAASTKDPVVLELESVGSDARTLRMHAVGFPPGEARAGTVAVFHDVSDIRRLEQVRRDFLAAASHELRTPLTSIRGFADTLQSSDLPPKQVRSYVDVIVRNAERLRALIDDLLELSRIESRRLPLHATEVDVARSCRLQLEDLAPRLEEQKLTAEFLGEDPALAWADTRAVEQILSNLLENAVRYTDPGGRIEIRTETQPNALAVSITDTGIGIPSEDLGRIFERFYRVDKARSRALGGTGLGLAIVKHLVQAMGGDIHVDSRAGEGSCFRFTLPRAAPDPDRVS